MAAQAPSQGQPPQQRTQQFQQQQVAATPGNNSTSISGGRSLADDPGESLDQYQEMEEDDSGDSRNEVQKKVQHSSDDKALDQSAQPTRDDKDQANKVQHKEVIIKNVRNEANESLPVAGRAQQTTNKQKTQLPTVADSEQKRKSTSSQVPPLKLETLNTSYHQNNTVTIADQNQKKQSIKEEQKKLSTEPKEEQDIEKQKPHDQKDQNLQDQLQPAEEQVLKEQSDKSQIIESELSPTIIKTEYENDDIDKEIIIDEAQEQQSQKTQKSEIDDDISVAHNLNDESLSKKTISDLEILEKSAVVDNGDLNGQQLKQQQNLRKDLTVKARVLAAIAVPDKDLLLKSSEHEEEEEQEEQSDHKSQEKIVEEIVQLSRQSDEHKDNEEIEQKEVVENLQETQQSVKVIPVAIVHESLGQLHQQEQDCYSKQKTSVKERRSTTDFKVKDSDVEADDLFKPQKTQIINISCSEKIDEDIDAKEVDQKQLKTSSKKATISVNYNNSYESNQDKSAEAAVHNIDDNGQQTNNMAEIIHWMLGKMNDKTILDYKTNPDQVVAQFLKDRGTDTYTVKSQKTPPLQEQTDSLLDEVEDLPQYFNHSDDKTNKSREVLIHLNSLPMEQFREKKTFSSIEEPPIALNKNQEPQQKFDKNYQTPSKIVETNEDNLSSEVYNSPYRDLKPVIEVSLLAQRSQSIRCHEDRKKRLEKVNDFASGLATRRQSNMQEQSYCQNFGDSPSIDLKIGKSINQDESMAKLTYSSIKSSSRISKTTSHASSKKMSESQFSRRSSSVDRLKPFTFAHKQSPQQSQHSDQNEENDKIDNFAELLNSIGISSEELFSDTTGQKQLKNSVLLKNTHLYQEDQQQHMIKTQKPTDLATIEMQIFFGQNVECDDQAHIQIESYNGQQKKIDSLTQKVLQNCEKVRDKMLSKKNNNSDMDDLNYLAFPRLSPLKHKAKSTNLLQFSLNKVEVRIFPQDQTPQSDDKAEGETKEQEDIKYEDLFKIDEINNVNAGERRISHIIGDSGRPNIMKTVKEDKSTGQVQQSRIASPLPGLTRLSSDKKRGIFSTNKNKHQTQENILTIQNKLNFKLGHSQTLMTKKSMKSDSSPLKAYEMAQKIKQERQEAEEEKQRFENILEARQSLEEKLYIKWLQPKRKFQIENRRRRYSGRRGGIMSTPGSLTNLLVLSMKDSSTSIPNSSIRENMQNNLSAGWVPNHSTPRSAARYQRPEISEFVDQILESMETNWNNFIHKQQMENCHFFNYDKLYSVDDDFDLNEQRLGEFDEEEKHKWGLNFEIKLVEINEKISVTDFEGLSPMKEEEENDSKDETESYDLSELSHRKDLLDISPNKEPPHFITKRVFEGGFIELIQRGEFSLNEQRIINQTLYQEILAKVGSDTDMLKKFQDSMMELNHRHYSQRIRRIQKLKQAPVTSIVLNHNVIKKDQLNRYIERPQIKSAPITYYLFYSSTKNNITKKLYKDEYRKTFYDLWLRTFQEFQEIYQEQEIEKKQKARIVKKNNILENNAGIGVGAGAGFLSTRQNTYTGKIDLISPQQHKTQMLLTASQKHSSSNLLY